MDIWLKRKKNRKDWTKRGLYEFFSRHIVCTFDFCYSKCYKYWPCNKHKLLAFVVVGFVKQWGNQFVWMWMQFLRIFALLKVSSRVGDWVKVKIDTYTMLKVKTIGQLSYLKVLSHRLGIGTRYARCALSHACWIALSNTF